MSEQIVSLRNSAGHALHCMFELPPPEAPKTDLACVLLSPGVKMRVAPHRLYRKLAGEFLQRGIAVMRVDFYGLGDSDGDLPEQQLDQLYRQVQLGRHVDDARSALRWLQREHGKKRFVIGGLCGGALTGLLASEVDESVAGLYAIGIPVVLDASGQHESQNMTQGQLRDMRGTYLSKLLNPAAWLRLLSFKSDFRSILRSLFPSTPGGGSKGKAIGDERVPPPATATAANLNPKYPPAMFGLLQRNRPALLIFSGADRLQFEYQEKFVAPWRAALEKFASLLTVEVIPQANHVLGDPSWMAQARAMTGRWLDERFK